MICNVCGSTINGAGQYCSVCGAIIPVEQAYAPPQSQFNQIPYLQPNQVTSGQMNFTEPSYYEQHSYLDENDLKPSPYQSNIGMSWFKFIIWVQLFYSAITNIVTAIRLITGSHYGGHQNVVYYYLKGMKTLDICMIVFSFLFATACIFVRFQLSGFKKRGPKLYLILMGCSMAMSIFYVTGLLLINSQYTEILKISNLGFYTTYFGFMIGISLLLLVANIVYFKKRKQFFVN